MWQKWNQRCERPHYIRQVAHDHTPFDDRSENLTPHRYVHDTLHDRVCQNTGPLLITIFAIHLLTMTFLLAPSRSSSWSSSKKFPYKNSHFPSLPASPVHLAQHYEDVLTSGRHKPKFFFSPQHPDLFWDPANILTNGYGWLLPHKWNGRGMQLATQVIYYRGRNVRSYASTLPYLFVASCNNQMDKFVLTAYP